MYIFNFCIITKLLKSQKVFFPHSECISSVTMRTFYFRLSDCKASVIFYLYTLASPVIINITVIDIYVLFAPCIVVSSGDIK